MKKIMLLAILLPFLAIGCASSGKCPVHDSISRCEKCCKGSCEKCCNGECDTCEKCKTAHCC